MLDLNKPKRLEAFVEIIRTFQVSSQLRKRAQALRASLPSLIRNVDELSKALLARDWRFDSMAVDIPAPSQIFGQLVASAGISGIVYPSKFNGKQCLAIYPQNFEDTDYFVELDDVPPAELKHRRLDASIWKEHKNELCGQ